MKKFLSIEKFKEVKVLFILGILMALFITMMLNNSNVNYWNWKAFVMSIGIWTLSSIVDKEKYLNLATLLATGFFMYLFWCLIFFFFPYN